MVFGWIQWLVLGIAPPEVALLSSLHYRFQPVVARKGHVGGVELSELLLPREDNLNSPLNASAAWSHCIPRRWRA